MLHSLGEVEIKFQEVERNELFSLGDKWDEW